MMKSLIRTKRYINAFSIVGGASGTVFGLAMALRYGVWNGLVAGFIAALSMGILGALILTPFDLYFTRGIPVEFLSVHQRRGLQVNGEPNDVFDQCVATLNELSFVRSFIPSKSEWCISAKTKASWASFGESLTLRFEAASPDVVKIQITSEPVFRFTLLDYGKNFRNAEAISRAIRTRFAA